MPKAKQQKEKPTSEEILKKGIIKITLAQLINSRQALQEFLALPKPILFAMDLSIAIKNQITPQIESFFESVKSLAKQFGVEKEIIKREDFKSEDAARQFFAELQTLQKKEIELNLKTITYSEIRSYIENSGIDTNQILVGDCFSRLDWLIVE